MRFNRHLGSVVMAIAFGILAASPAPAFIFSPPAEAASMILTGRLDNTAGLGGQGQWMQSPMSIEWVIRPTADGWWIYEYIFSHRTPATSHFILEVSPDFTRDQIRNCSWAFENGDPSWYGPHPSNPGIPGSIFGLKFDVGEPETPIRFESSRAPVWGDFYAKGGPNSAAWNLGFLDQDPVDAAASGSIGKKILRPNGESPSPVPEPAGVLLMGVALVGVAVVAGVRRRRS